MSAIVESIELMPVGALAGSMPVKLTRGINILHIESRNPFAKNNMPLSAVRLNDDKFGLQGIPVVRLSAEQGDTWIEWTFSSSDKERLLELLKVGS